MDHTIYTTSLFWSILICCTSAFCGSYYFDADNGSDSLTGNSPSEAWQTLQKANTHLWKAGDTLKFKAGQTWSGKLAPQNSGSPGLPIVIDSFGIGKRPLFDGQGSKDEVIGLTDQQYWEIRNIAVTNTHQYRSFERRGITIRNTGSGALRYFRLHNLFIHHINGKGESFDAGAIHFLVTAFGDNKFDDILIDSCTLLVIDGDGMAFFSGAYDPDGDFWKAKYSIPHPLDSNKAFTRLVVRHCFLDSVGGDGIVPMTAIKPLVEHCVARTTCGTTKGYSAPIWLWHTDSGVLQYNEVYDSKNAGRDGMAYDFDRGAIGCILQYCYSHENDGGFFMGMRRNGIESGHKIRYNISLNDRDIIFTWNAGEPSNTVIHNNLIYVKKGRKVKFCGSSFATRKDGAPAFYNNIIYADGTINSFEWGNATYSHNLYYGNCTGIPKDKHKFTFDPKLFGPLGDADTGFAYLDAYKLNENSPCFGVGLPLDTMGSYDFWGSPLPDSGRVNLGPFVSPPQVKTHNAPNRDRFNKRQFYFDGSGIVIEDVEKSNEKIILQVIDLSGREVVKVPVAPEYHRVDMGPLNRRGVRMYIARLRTMDNTRVDETVFLCGQLK
jgi:hypothetical protein